MDDPSNASKVAQNEIFALARDVRDRGAAIWVLQRTLANAVTQDAKQQCMQKIADIQAHLDVAMLGADGAVRPAKEAQ